MCVVLNVFCMQTQLQSERFFGKPKLALDAVGGESATRLADALEQVGSPHRVWLLTLRGHVCVVTSKDRPCVAQAVSSRVAGWHIGCDTQCKGLVSPARGQHVSGMWSRLLASAMCWLLCHTVGQYALVHDG
jgi:hypothetical protein